MVPLVYYLDNNDSEKYSYYVTPSNPIKKYVSHLGSAVHSNYTVSPVLSQLSPLLSPLSPLLSPIITIKNNKNKPKIIIETPVSPILMPNNINYINVNNDPVLTSKVTKYFFEKTMNVWLHSDFEELLSFLLVKGDKVRLVKNKSEKDRNEKDTVKSIERKVEYIAENIMNKYDMKSFLKKYVLKSGIDFWNLKKYKSHVKRSIYKKLKSKLNKLAFH